MLCWLSGIFLSNRPHDNIKAMLFGKSIPTIESMLQEVRGWLQVSEGKLLYGLARDWPGSGRVVEIGSYQGRSTVCLASGLRDRRQKSPPLLAIDTHRGSGEHQPGMPYFDPAAYDGEKGKVDTLPVLRSNLARFGLPRLVEIRDQPSIAACEAFQGAIRILFIDADHDETAVRLDVERWSVFLEPEGLLVLHDVGAWPGPTRVAAELESRGRFRKIIQVETTAALVLRER